MPAKKRRKAETRRYNVDFMTEMAILSQLTTSDVKKACCTQSAPSNMIWYMHLEHKPSPQVLEALRKLLLKQLREKKKAKIPNIANIKIHHQKEQPARKKHIFGIERDIRASPAVDKMRAAVVANFKSAL